MGETAEATPFGYVRHQLAPWGEERDFSVEIGSGGGDFIDQGASVGFWGVRIQNLALGPLYATGGIGMRSGDAGKFVSKYKREVDVTTPRAVLGVETGGSIVRGYLRGTNDLELNPDGYLSVDSRVAAGIGLAVGQLHALFDTTVARTKVWVPEQMPVAAITGGGSLALAHPLARHLDATMRIEAARSFYAGNMASLDFVPRWGVNAFAALQATIGH
jgi:hypothetical protein